MRSNWFQKLFGRKKKTPLVLTAEEAYAQEVSEAPDDEPKRPEPADEAAAQPIAAEEEPIPAAVPAKAEAKPVERAPFAPRAVKRALMKVYACVEDADYAYAMVRKCFDQVPGGSQDAPKQFVLRAPGGMEMRVAVHTDARIRDAVVPRLAGAFADSPLESEDVKRAALMQIGLFNTEVTAEIVAPPDSVEIALYADRLYRAAEALRGFVLTEEMRMYRWDGRMLISADGHTDFTEFMPVMYTKPKPETPVIDTDQARRERTLARFRDMGINAPDKLPRLIKESDCALKPADEIINRLAAVFTCALQAHAYSSPREVPAPTTWMTSALIRLNNQYSVSRLFTPRETEYIMRHRSELDEMFLSKYECCGVFLWAIGLMELGAPGEKCDRSKILSILRGSDTDMLFRIAKPRAVRDVMDLHDETVCLHRACVDAQMRGEPLTHVDADVVYERHYALNWLLAVGGAAEWDRIVL